MNQEYRIRHGKGKNMFIFRPLLKVAIFFGAPGHQNKLAHIKIVGHMVDYNIGHIRTYFIS